MKQNSTRWALKTFILSICLSIVFSVISQSLFPHLSVVMSIFVIVFFIVLSTVFDMVGVAVTSTDMDKLNQFKDTKGYETAMRLALNTEKVSSFCGDVVGDICGILSGAGGVSLVLSMHITEPNIYFIVTCVVSSLIAGLTIFCKAIMKGYAVSNAETVVIKTAKLLEFSPKTLLLKKKNRKKYKIKKKNEKKHWHCFSIYVILGE